VDRETTARPSGLAKMSAIKSNKHKSVLNNTYTCVWSIYKYILSASVLLVRLVMFYEFGAHNVTFFRVFIDTFRSRFKDRP